MLLQNAPQQPKSVFRSAKRQLQEYQLNPIVPDLHLQNDRKQLFPSIFALFSQKELSPENLVTRIYVTTDQHHNIPGHSRMQNHGLMSETLRNLQSSTHHVIPAQFTRPHPHSRGSVAPMHYHAARLAAFSVPSVEPVHSQARLDHRSRLPTSRGENFNPEEWSPDRRASPSLAGRRL